MARKPSRTPPPTVSLQRFWEKYGTWVSSVVVGVLIVVLVMTLLERHRSRQVARGRAELDNVQRDDPGAVMRLKKLELDYADTELVDVIRLRLAQALLRAERHDEAEQAFNALLENKDLLKLYRVQTHLGLAYVAQGKKDYVEARRRFKQVEEDKLYAVEARRMLELIDKLEKEKPAPGLPEAPEK